MPSLNSPTYRKVVYDGYPNEVVTILGPPVAVRGFGAFAGYLGWQVIERENGQRMCVSEEMLRPVRKPDTLRRGDLLPVADGGWVRVLNPDWPNGDEAFCERAEEDVCR